jgi:hypothetical protein
MLVKPDFSEVSGNDPVPPGTYSARIKECEQRESKAGNPYLNWKLELFGTPEVNNRVVFHMTMVKGKAAFRLQELYSAATGEQISDKTGFDTDMLIGKEITVTLTEAKDQEGNVRPFPEVKAVAALKH